MLRLPRYVPVFALHLETGLQLLETRWQKATFKLISTISTAEDTRISRVTMDAAFKNSIPWANAVSQWIRMLSKGETQVPHAHGGLAGISAYIKSHMHPPLLCADARLHMECLQMPSLSLYSSLRCFTKIPKQYAWSKSQIGKPASCYHEMYLDAWSHDRTGVRLKFLARCNALHWSGYCGCGFSGRIPLRHIFFDCPSFEPARTSRDARLFKIFQSHIHPENSFNWETYISADYHLKLQICLGKRSGNPVLDKKIDTVVRLFLRAVLSSLSD